MSAEQIALPTPTVTDLDRAREAALAARSSLAHSVMTDVRTTANLSDHSRALAATAIEADACADRVFAEWWHNTLTDEERGRVMANDYFDKYGHSCVICTGQAKA